MLFPLKILEISPNLAHFQVLGIWNGTSDPVISERGFCFFSFPSLVRLAFSAWIPYVGAMIGSISGGWFSGFLIRKGKTVNYARKFSMLLGGIIIIPSIIASVMANNPILAVVLMAFVLFGGNKKHSIQSIHQLSKSPIAIRRWTDIVKILIV